MRPHKQIKKYQFWKQKTFDRFKTIEHRNWISKLNDFAGGKNESAHTCRSVSTMHIKWAIHLSSVRISAKSTTAKQEKHGLPALSCPISRLLACNHAVDRTMITAGSFRQMGAAGIPRHTACCSLRIRRRYQAYQHCKEPFAANKLPKMSLLSNLFAQKFWVKLFITTLLEIQKLVGTFGSLLLVAHFSFSRVLLIKLVCAYR